MFYIESQYFNVALLAWIEIAPCLLSAPAFPESSFAARVGKTPANTPHMAESQSSSRSSSSSLPVISKTYTLTSEEVEMIQSVAQEEGMRTDSSAMRLLLREGYKFRQLRREAESALINQSIRDEHSA